MDRSSLKSPPSDNVVERILRGSDGSLDPVAALDYPHAERLAALHLTELGLAHRRDELSELEIGVRYAARLGLTPEVREIFVQQSHLEETQATLGVRDSQAALSILVEQSTFIVAPGGRRIFFLASIEADRKELLRLAEELNVEIAAGVGYKKSADGKLLVVTSYHLPSKEKLLPLNTRDAGPFGLRRVALPLLLRSSEDRLVELSRSEGCSSESNAILDNQVRKIFRVSQRIDDLRMQLDKLPISKAGIAQWMAEFGPRFILPAASLDAKFMELLPQEFISKHIGGSNPGDSEARSTLIDAILSPDIDAYCEREAFYCHDAFIDDLIARTKARGEELTQVHVHPLRAELCHSLSELLEQRAQSFEADGFLNVSEQELNGLLDQELQPLGSKLLQYRSTLHLIRSAIAEGAKIAEVVDQRKETERLCPAIRLKEQFPFPDSERVHSWAHSIIHEHYELTAQVREFLAAKGMDISDIPVERLNREIALTQTDIDHLRSIRESETLTVEQKLVALIDSDSQRAGTFAESAADADGLRSYGEKVGGIGFQVPFHIIDNPLGSVTIITPLSAADSVQSLDGVSRRHPKVFRQYRVGGVIDGHQELIASPDLERRLVGESLAAGDELAAVPDVLVWDNLEQANFWVLPDENKSLSFDGAWQYAKIELLAEVFPEIVTAQHRRFGGTHALFVRLGEGMLPRESAGLINSRLKTLGYDRLMTKELLGTVLQLYAQGRVVAAKTPEAMEVALLRERLGSHILKWAAYHAMDSISGLTFEQRYVAFEAVFDERLTRAELEKLLDAIELHDGDLYCQLDRTLKYRFFREGKEINWSCIADEVRPRKSDSEIIEDQALFSVYSPRTRQVYRTDMLVWRSRLF